MKELLNGYNYNWNGGFWGLCYNIIVSCQENDAKLKITTIWWVTADSLTVPWPVITKYFRSSVKPGAFHYRRSISVINISLQWSEKLPIIPYASTQQHLLNFLNLRIPSSKCFFRYSTATTSKHNLGKFIDVEQQKSTKADHRSLIYQEILPTFPVIIPPVVSSHFLH